MTAQHERSAGLEKRLRYEASSTWDEPSESSFPRRWAVPLILAAAAYALYRVVQTNVMNLSGGSTLTVGQRSVISVADALFMAALVPLAFWTTRRFPVAAPAPWKHLAAHVVVGFLGAAAWIAGLVTVAGVVTGAARDDFFVPAYLNWLTANLFAYAALSRRGSGLVAESQQASVVLGCVIAILRSRRL